MTSSPIFFYMGVPPGNSVSLILVHSTTNLHTQVHRGTALGKGLAKELSKECNLAYLSQSPVHLCMTNKLSMPKPCMCTILCSQNCTNLSSYLSTQRETCSSSLYKFLFSEQSLLTTFSVVGFSFSFSSEKRKTNMGKTVN